MKTSLPSATPRAGKCAPPPNAGWNEALHAFEFRYRRLFETAPHGILLLDAGSGKITDANPFALELLDFPFEELCGRELWEIGRYEEIAESRASFRKLQQTRHAHSDHLALRTKSGEVIAVEVESSIYDEGEQEVAQCIIRRDSEPTSRAPSAWLRTHSERLRAPLTEIAWMMGLMELEQSLVPQPRSRFDEAALRHVRRNLQMLIQAFNQLSARTGESLLWLAGSLSPPRRSAPPPRRRESVPLSLADQPYHS